MIRTYEKPERVRLDVYLVPLLEVGAGEQRAALHELLLNRVKEEASSLVKMTNSSLQKSVRRMEAKRLLEEREHKGHGTISLLELERVGFDLLGEPYIRLELSKLQVDVLLNPWHWP